MMEEEARDAIDRVAREWIGTPYHDHASVKGRNGGVDCGMLMRAVYVEAGVIGDFPISNYSPQHYLHRHDEHYLGYVRQFAHEINADRVKHGDIVLYRLGKCFAHGAIVIKPGWPHIVHAHSIARCVRKAFGNAVHLGMTILDVKFFSLW